MHRKSLEAADQLKDDNSCASDKEEGNEGDKSDGNSETSKTNKSQNAQENNNNNNNKDNSSNQQPQGQQQQQQQQQHQINQNYDSRFQNDRGSSQLMSNERLLQNERLPGDRSSLPTDPEEFRNNSIACLRAKAQEHQAKLLGFSTDALMLVNSSSGQRRNGSCDANANSINHHHHLHQQNDVLNSSDTSSSLF